MKRIEAIIASEKVNAVNEALKKAGVGGATILDAKGRGKGEKPRVAGGRGTSAHLAEFSVRANVITVVDDGDVDRVIKAILDAASTGSAGDGKIFVSSVGEAVDIGSKKRSQSGMV
ncbi:nitrogen regulatory protein P-II family [Candidatus Nitrososphaera evergladensis SR1]|jgi:nitrogen regulatory protein P-II 1|uniref:Nitrogen regulatory protein P-II family n=1 Tax=Candidatus Nitrososphaera evergladensis SR1 TaxID=1459636 RepID=A0A075MT92_9ARCH|nr:P-II family nitrogen regulator [Candidatus Nitrososphaera evergladensis]AIF84771.1 nitrogen regulatory protein P-II family [Candidatus Nitrososphaera evergladensis SR1]